MIYKKIKMEYHYKKDRLNRTLLVREDINLIELGCAMCTAVRAEFEHCFLFLKGKTSFSPDVFMENSWDSSNEVPMKKYSLSDLGDKFSFWYDTGDDWLFDCKVYKKETELESNNLAFLVDGTGQGIWEDDSYTLNRYLCGELDPECSEEDEEEGICFPWNYDIEKLSDFDTSFDIEEEKENFDFMLDVNIEEYLNGMHEGGFELEVKPRTQEAADNMDMDDNAETLEDMRVDTIMQMTVDDQIEIIDFLDSKYKELTKKYDDFTAENVIGEVLSAELLEMMENGKPYSKSDYKKKYSRIK